MRLKRRVVPLLLMALLAAVLASSVQGLSEVCWVSGKTTSSLEPIIYNGTDSLAFNFSVTESNASWITVYPLEISVIIPTVDVDSSLPLGTSLNMTGYFDDGGNFIPTAINSFDTSPEWLQTLKALWNLCGLAARSLVMLVVQVFQGLLGIQLPEWLVNLALISLVTFGLAKFGKKLPVVLLAIAFLVAAALVGNLVATLMV